MAADFDAITLDPHPRPPPGPLPPIQCNSCPYRFIDLLARHSGFTDHIESQQAYYIQELMADEAAERLFASLPSNTSAVRGHRESRKYVTHSELQLSPRATLELITGHSKVAHAIEHAEESA